jgi:hypothetical protein
LRPVDVVEVVDVAAWAASWIMASFPSIDII